MNLQERLRRSDDTVLWVHRQLDGLHIGDGNKRVHLAAGCLHAVVEHGQAIVVLVHEGIHGSALALVRLQFEAYVRGTWLLYGASDEGVDRAGRDTFHSHSPPIFLCSGRTGLSGAVMIYDKIGFALLPHACVVHRPSPIRPSLGG